MMRNILICIALIATGASAQTVASGPGAVLRMLDKTSGHTKDIELRTGQGSRVGSLQITLRDCRYPAGNPAGNAFAGLEIIEPGKAGVLFSGWMIASAPALSALEHPRYDVWVLRCMTS